MQLNIGGLPVAHVLRHYYGPHIATSEALFDTTFTSKQTRTKSDNTLRVEHRRPPFYCTGQQTPTLHQATQQHCTSKDLTGTGAGLGPSPAPRCSPQRAPCLPGDGGTPAASISSLSCHSPCPCCACWSSQAVMEDSGGPGATSHTQARSRTSKDERLRIGTFDEKTRRSTQKRRR